MIIFENFAYYLPQGFLFHQVNLQINQTDKIGLVGKNGAGKSTLLKLISKKIMPTEGKIHIPKETTIGYLDQDLEIKSSKMLKSYLLESNIELNEINFKIDNINQQLIERTDYESNSYLSLLDDLEELNHRFNMLEGNHWEEDVEITLKGLGFELSEFSKPIDSFSGGWKMRAELAKILVNKPKLLLLDEPTNHLDIISIGWLEEYLTKFQGLVILISHDRLFLDRVTNKTLEISSSKIFEYPLPYSKYKIKREEEKLILQRAKKNQDKEIKKTEELINKFRAKSSKATFAQSLIKKLDKTDRIEVEEEDFSSMKLVFPVNQNPGKVILEINQLSKSYEEKTIFEDITLTLARGDKIALLGPNGVGKTTLFKCIMSDIEFKGEITFGHNVNPSYFAQNQVSILDPNLTIFETVELLATGENRKNIRSILGSFLFSGDDIDKKVSVLSGGEKTRLSICSMLFKPSNFLILDEPTNHLDIKSKEVLKKALVNYSGTFLLVSHDREFLDDLTNQIWDIEDKKLKIHYFSVNEYLAYKKESLEFKSKNEINKKIKFTAQKPTQKKDKKTINKTNFEIEKIEKKIEKIENDIKNLEDILLSLDYSDPDYNKFVTEYEKLKQELVLMIKKWEQLLS